MNFHLSSIPLILRGSQEGWIQSQLTLGERCGTIARLIPEQTPLNYAQPPKHVCRKNFQVIR